MSEANTTAQSAHNMAHILQDSATSQIKLPEKSSKSKPTLSLFSSGEREDFGNSFGNEGVGVLSASWKSSEGTLSPPLSDTGGYVPSASAPDKVEDKQESGGGKREVPPMDKNKDGKVETGKKLQESDTKSRIQAGELILIDFNLVKNQSRGHAKKVKCSSTSKRLRAHKSGQKTL